MPQEDFDAAMSEQLARFARRVAGGDDITVTFKEGVALIEGRVASSTQARALADLIGGHDGVARVDTRLRIEVTRRDGVPGANRRR